MDSLWLVPLPDRSSEGVVAKDGGAEDGGGYPYALVHVQSFSDEWCREKFIQEADNVLLHINAQVLKNRQELTAMSA